MLMTFLGALTSCASLCGASYIVSDGTDLGKLRPTEK